MVRTSSAFHPLMKTILNAASNTITPVFVCRNHMKKPAPEEISMETAAEVRSFRLAQVIKFTKFIHNSLFQEVFMTFIPKTTNISAHIVAPSSLKWREKLKQVDKKTSMASRDDNQISLLRKLKYTHSQKRIHSLRSNLICFSDDLISNC